MPSPHGFAYFHCCAKYPFDDQCLSCSDIFLRQVQLLQHGLLPQLQLVLFSVGLFYWCLKTRISGCYVKYANGAVSHLQIRKQVEKKRNHSGFQDSKEALWQLSSASSMCTLRTIHKKSLHDSKWLFTKLCHFVPFFKKFLLIWILSEK